MEGKWKERSSGEKGWGILVDKKLNLSHPAPLKHSGSTRQSQASRQMLIPMVIHNTSAVTSPALPSTYSSDELQQSQHRDTVESPSVEVHETKLNVVLNNLL